MNPAFETAEEIETTETIGESQSLVFPTFPPLEDDPSPEAAKELVAIYDHLIDTLPPVSRHTLDAFADAVEQVKRAGKAMDERRKAKVGPLNTEVKAINDAYMPFVNKFDAMWRRLAEIPNRFIAEQKRLADEEQRRLNAIAEQRRIEEEKKAQADRDAAAQALEQGNEKLAAKLEARADSHEMKAATAVAPVVEGIAKKIDTGTSTTSFSGGKKTWALPGWDKESKLPCNSPLLSALVGDITTLPAGVRFLLEHSHLSPVLLNKSYSPEKPLPKPFAEITDFGGATSRGRK